MIAQLQYANGCFHGQQRDFPSQHHAAPYRTLNQVVHVLSKRDIYTSANDIFSCISESVLIEFRIPFEKSTSWPISQQQSVTYDTTQSGAQLISMPLLFTHQHERNVVLHKGLVLQVQARNNLQSLKNLTFAHPHDSNHQCFRNKLQSMSSSAHEHKTNYSSRKDGDLSDNPIRTHRQQVDNLDDPLQIIEVVQK